MYRGPSRRRGAVLTYVAILLMVLIGFVGIALDWGYVFLTSQQLQNAADGASMAGAQHVFNGPAAVYAAASGIAEENGAGGKRVGLAENLSNDPDGDVVMGVYNRGARSFTPTVDPADEPNAVKVLARRTTGSPRDSLPLFFGPMFGKDTANISRFAIAMVEGKPAYADIISLNAHEPESFYMHGDVVLNVGNGDGSVQVNSDDTLSSGGAALIQGTSATFSAATLNVVGEQKERGNPIVPDDINEGVPYVQDPLLTMPEPIVPDPPIPTYPAKPKITGTGTFHPGYYRQGLEMNAGDNVFLEPGVYILDNGFRLNGNSILTGYGVIFYLHTGSIHDNGTGDVFLTPPTGDPYNAIQFFQARDNTEEAQFNGDTTWQGSQTDDTSTPDIDESTIGAGTFYFPVAPVEFGGNGTLTFNGLIADKIEVYGNGTVNVTGGYESNKGNLKVYLVE